MAETTRDAGLEERSGAGFDGTRLRYWIRRRGPRWLLICTGYGGTRPAWVPLLEQLDDEWSVLLWDYRGQYGSDAPPGEHPIPIDDHSRDLDALMQAEGIERGVLMAWSVGVQVALEHYRRRHDTVEALVLISGAYERVLHSPWGPGLGACALRGVIRAMGAVGTPIHLVVSPLVKHAPLARLAVLLRVARGDPAEFVAPLRAFADLDVKRYMAMTLTADEHVTSDMLETVRVPTLILCGDHDALTPATLAERLHHLISGSELVIIPDTTHYAILEKPTFVATAIDGFLSRTRAREPVGAAD